MMTLPTLSPAPAGACDCHVHIYAPGYPLAPSATFTPPPAPLSAYREVQRALGLQRVVLVQPTGYGFDNSCLLDALGELGSETARGIVVVPADVEDAELERLHAAGVRGVRYMMIAGAGGLLGWDTLERMAARIAPLGWNINLQLDGRDLPLHQAVLDRLPCKLVIDHIGKFLEPVRSDNPSFRALLAILERGNRWVKLAAPYETSRLGPPHYSDVAVLARKLAHTHPQACLWASNWPHPNRVPVPHDDQMLALLGKWVPPASVREGILVHNPALVYGFTGLVLNP